MSKEIVKYDIAAGFILDKDNRILLQKKDSEYHWFPSYWSFFGGQIEENETPEQAFHREMLEEFDKEEDRLIDNISFLFELPFSEPSAKQNIIREGKLHVFNANFIGDISDISIKEGAGFAFFERGEIEKINLIPVCRDSIKKAFTKLNINNK